MSEQYTLTIEGVEFVFEKEKMNDAAFKFRMLRAYSGLNRKEFSRWSHIPYDTLRDWESGENKVADYIFELIAYKLVNEKQRGNI